MQNHEMLDNTLKNKKTPNAGIGIFGGTFDPIHIGHVKSIDAVATWLHLDKVLIIPAHIPPHKTDSNITPKATSAQRATMVELAIADKPLFYCDRRELSRNGPSFTIDTLKELKATYPNQTLYFVIGMDSLQTFTTWHKYKEILSLCHLVVNTRPNYHLSDLNRETKNLLTTHQVKDISTLKNQHTGAILFAKPMHIDISSTEIRNNISAQQSNNVQISSSVIDFINKNQLYR